MNIAMKIAAAVVAAGTAALIYRSSTRSNPITSDDAADVRRRIRKMYFHASAKKVREELGRVNEIFERAAREKTDREDNEILLLARIEEKELAEMLREKLVTGRANPRGSKYPLHRVQTILVPKDHKDVRDAAHLQAAARRVAERHGAKHGGKIDEKTNFYAFRQTDPKDAMKGSYISFKTPGGVVIVKALPKNVLSVPELKKQVGATLAKLKASRRAA